MLRILLPIKLFTLLLAITLSQVVLALHKPYIQTTASYVSSGNFQGAGGSLVFGTHCTEFHCFEAEIGFTHLSADTTPLYSRSSKQDISYLDSDTEDIPFIITGTMTNILKLQVCTDIDELPILFNYRFKHNFSRIGTGIYAGMGIGLNFTQTRCSTQVIQNESVYFIPKDIYWPEDTYVALPVANKPNTHTNDWSICPVGQIFAGISHNLTQRLSFLIGAKLLFTKKYEVVSSEEVFGKLLQTRSLQKSIEVGLNYQF